MKLLQPAYKLSVQNVVQALKTDPNKGLTEVEALHRLEQFGENNIDLKQQKQIWRIFLEQFISPLVAVLGIAAVLAFLFEEWLEGSAVVVVIFLNASIGFYMEWQARRSMNALRKLSQITTKAYRDNRLQAINAVEIVIGDLLFLEAGDVVPADARIVELHRLGVMEAALTGESIQVVKLSHKLGGKVMLAEQKNMVFKGTTVTRGNAKAIVVATGQQTELGKIANMTQEAEKAVTPLEKKLIILTRKLIWITFVLASLILVIGLLREQEFYLMMETAIALTIAAIPEGLPIVATIALARGMLRLARHQVIVKRLNAVETLGETDVVFTDKTGTLTENKLSVETVVLPNSRELGRPIEWHLKSTAPLSDNCFDPILKIGTLCNNATLSEVDGSASLGDPLEVAILELAKDVGAPVNKWLQQYTRVREIPFDSNTKMMGTLHKDGERENYWVAIKGAMEVVLAESDYVLSGEEWVPIAALRRLWLEKANQLAADGLRVLGLAFSEINEPREDFSHHLVFVGCLAFLDPPRTEVKQALKTCLQAGIKVIMVTGDHTETAKNIAIRTGLAPPDKIIVIHGKEIEAFEHLGEENKQMLLHANVFARVSPSQKLELVRFYQRNGHTVGMTGDGINDAPALKKADIGMAMGYRGTEAAKEAGDLILENNAFSSIVLAIRQGRGIFQNIRYFVIYLLSCNLSELLVVFVASIANFSSALLPLQILFLNMVTDVFPALALGSNREPDNVMEQAPRSNKEPIITTQIWQFICGYALAISLACIGILFFAIYYLKVSPTLANNMTFYTLIFAQLWHLFNLPDASQSFWKNEITTNRHIWWAIVLCIFITGIVYLVPTFRVVLSLESISLYLLGYSLLFSLFPVIIIQGLKEIKKAALTF